MTPVAYTEPDQVEDSPIEPQQEEEEFLGTTTEDESEISQYEVTVVGSLKKRGSLQPKEKEKKNISFNPVVEVVDVKRKLFQ